jgi:hypothetical protein
MTGILAALAAPGASDSGDFIGITDVGITDSVVGGTAGASYQLDNLGKVNLIRAHASTITSDAVIPNANIVLYEAFVTVTSGSLTSGTTGAWVALSSTRTWNKQVTNAAASVAFDLQLRLASNQIVVKTIHVTIEVDGSP